MGVEIHGHRHILLEQLYEFIDARGRNQTTHILDGNHIGTQRSHLFGFIHKVVVGEHGLGVFLATQTVQQRELGILGVDGVAHRAVGDTAILLNVLDGRFDVVHVVQSVEDTHNAKTRFNRVAAEAFDDFVGVGRITKQVTTTRQRGEFRHTAHSLVDGFESCPGVFAKVTHHRIGYCATPHLHSVESSVFIEGEHSVNLLLSHTSCER